jgi:hypothetical protein
MIGPIRIQLTDAELRLIVHALSISAGAIRNWPISQTHRERCTALANRLLYDAGPLEDVAPTLPASEGEGT